MSDNNKSELYGKPEKQKNAFEYLLSELGLSYWEYDIPTHKLYHSGLTQNDVGYDSCNDNVPDSHINAGIIHPDYTQAYLNFYHNIQKGQNGRLVFRSKNENGKWGWLDITFKVLFDSSDKPVKAIGVGVDITTQKDTELAFLTSQQDAHRLEQLLKTAATYDYDYLSFIDGNTQSFITYSSCIPDGSVRKADNYEQYLQDDIKNSYIVNPEKLSEALRWNNILNALNSNEVYSIFANEYDKEGKSHRKEFRFYYIDKEKCQILGSVRDITESYEESKRQHDLLEKALKTANEASAAKSRFLSSMSHDIRTPMNAIVNLTRMAREDQNDPTQLLSDLDKIERSSNFLLELINDILDMSRIESGKLKLTPTVYSYNKFVDYIESVIMPLCSKKNIQFIWNHGETSFPLYVDEVRFNQIFFNVLSNAVKYTSDGGKITIDEKNNQINNNILSVDFVITDTGCGMSYEFQKKLFQPFERENNVTAYNGTGLGLVITKDIIEKMGGSISIASEPGVGTKVTIHLDLLLATEEQVKAAAMSVSAFGDELFPGRGLRILAAEDHELNREIVTRILKKKGITVEWAENGKDALEMFILHPQNYYDAVLMDVRMPVMNGLEATVEIRKISASIPIIAMTSDAFSEDVKRCLDAGMNAHLPKPINANDMYKTIATFVGKYKKADDQT